MNEDALYCVSLDQPDFYVEFYAPKGLTQSQILERAIEEMTRKTSIWSVSVKEL